MTMATTRKGVFISHDGSIVATLDDYAPVELNGELFTQTIRTAACEVLVDGVRCVPNIIYGNFEKALQPLVCTSLR